MNIVSRSNNLKKKSWLWVLKEKPDEENEENLEENIDT